MSWRAFILDLSTTKTTIAANTEPSTTMAQHLETPAELQYSTGDNAVLVLSTGSAYGNHYTTEQVLDALVHQQKIQGNFDFDADVASRVLKGCGFKFHSIALPLEDVFCRFTRTEYLHHRVTNLVGLAERAGRQALERWGGEPSEITHLFWGTMTGAMHSPTTDIELVSRLGLNPDVERTSIEGMGW
mmetsp:Transcript_7671/g.19108  ORF Transcript_7671/g.19108 Transcript_7671/m.19108 type:complete len:187 (+) Transcript_7671:255-815(+)